MSDRFRETAPALIELWCISLNSAKDCRVSDLQASLGHDLGQVAVRQLIAQIPAHKQNDDFLLEVSTFE